LKILSTERPQPTARTGPYIPKTNHYWKTIQGG
jgi:hypothetical protein